MAAVTIRNLSPETHRALARDAMPAQPIRVILVDTNVVSDACWQAS